MNVLHLARTLSFNETTLELIQNGCLDLCQKHCTICPFTKRWTEMLFLQEGCHSFQYTRHDPD